MNSFREQYLTAVLVLIAAHLATVAAFRIAIAISDLYHP